MRTIPRDRRTRRSHEPQRALALQLDRVRDEARLDALVLATEEGLAIAQSGEPELCEELAALAPFMESGELPSVAAPTACVHTLRLAGEPLYLVSYSQDSLAQAEHWLEHASRGIVRILAA